MLTKDEIIEVDSFVASLVEIYRNDERAVTREELRQIIDLLKRLQQKAMN